MDPGRPHSRLGEGEVGLGREGEMGRPLTQGYLFWKAPRETFKVSLWTPLAPGIKLSVPPPTGLFLYS